MPEAPAAVDLVDARVGAEEERERAEEQQHDQDQGDHVLIIAHPVDKDKS